MAKNYLKMFVTCAAMASSLAMNAVERPPLPVQTLTEGEQYVLFNYVRPDGYMSRTSWDGAVYFLGPQDSNFASHAFTAVKNSNGSWSFTYTTTPEEEGAEPVVNYMAIPFGTDNLNFKADEYAEWFVEEGDYDGYYYIKAGEGNYSYCIDRHLHLNGGGQYIISSEPSIAQFYPDYYGGTIKDEYGDDVVDNEGYAVMADSTSLNWAFVKASDVTDFYIFKASAYVAITNFEKAYLATEGYEAGFQNAVDAAAALYGAEDFDEESVMLINELFDAKKALYQEILKAKELNTTEDAVLAASVETAMTAFNTLTDTEALATATQTLLDAEIAYQMGSGEITGLGKNMSFEDLSSQGGNTTTGIGAAPAGWNLYLNGVLSNTADEIRAQGVTAWCGTNADCTGEAKDGNYGFGIWNQAIPETELSQTIVGLENGTYEVSAALMVGSNGNGSRRTTQRIFGNLNSTYFGAESEYDFTSIDNSEVYSFAGLQEPYTDTELQNMTVRAYVYDGTLTFGMRTNGNIKAALRTASNTAGGDGWFKVDNFRIKKIGYVGEDAAAVANHYIGLCTEYSGSGDYQMQASVAESLDAKLAQYGEITAETPEADIIAAILGMKDELAVVESSVKAYQKLYEAVQQHYEYLDEYALYAGAGEYGDAIMEAEGVYDDGEADEAGIESIIAGLELALQECKKSGVAVGVYVNVIENPSFEDMSNQPGGDSGGVANAPKGWTLTLNGVVCSTASEISSNGVAAWCAINSGDGISVDDGTGNIITQQPTDGAKLWGIWTAAMPDVELSQTIEGMPAGKYVLSADVMVQNNWAGDNITTQRLFANGYVQMFASEEAHAINLPEDAKAAAAIDAVAGDDLDIPHLTYANYTCESGDRTTDLLRPMSVEFGVGEEGIINLGFRTNAVNVNGYDRNDGSANCIDGQGWFKVDNFQLYYESEEIPTSIGNVKNNGVLTTVVGRELYTLNGVKVANLQKGINVVKNIMSDGSVKVTKIFVK